MTSQTKKNILYVQPRNKIRRERFAPLSLITLASLTPENYFNIEIIDEQFQKISFSRKYDLICITVQTVMAIRAYQIADRFRRLGCKVILGGIHVTFMPEEAKNHADSIVLYEAEEIWGNILNDFLNGKVMDIYHGSHIDMANFPLIKTKFYNKKLYLAPTIIATRGCPNRCEFCSVQVFNGNHIRVRPVNHVIKDLMNFKKISKFIAIFDDNLFSARDYALKFFRRMVPLKIYWGAQAPIQVAFDDELLDLAYKSGCRYMTIGFESINEKSLRSVNKVDYIRKYAYACKKIKKKGIFLTGTFILGLDYDDKNTIKDTLNFAIENKLDDIFFHILRPLPGTKLFVRLLKENRISTFDWSQYEKCVIIPKNISPQELAASIDLAYKKFFSIPCIFERAKGLKNYKMKRLLLYLYFNLLRLWRIKKMNPEVYS